MGDLAEDCRVPDKMMAVRVLALFAMPDSYEDFPDWLYAEKKVSHKSGM
jgi:hypothetical protein